MRHDQIHDSNSYARVDIAAVWPAGTSVAAVPLPEAEDLAEVRADFAPTPAAPCCLPRRRSASAVLRAPPPSRRARRRPPSRQPR